MKLAPKDLDNLLTSDLLLLLAKNILHFLDILFYCVHSFIAAAHEPNVFRFLYIIEMYILHIIFLALFSIVLPLPRVAAQLTSTFSCYTVPGEGPASKEDSTYYASTTSTIFETKIESLTTTVEGQVPDSTVTVHKQAYRTEWCEEYVVCV